MVIAHIGEDMKEMFNYVLLLVEVWIRSIKAATIVLYFIYPSQVCQ